MSTDNLTPSGFTGGSSYSLTGAATVYDALSDGSNSSYVTLTGSAGNIRIAFTDTSLPAGSQILYAFVQAKVAKVGSSISQLIVDTDDFGGSTTNITWTLPTLATFLTETLPASADLDSEEVYFFANLSADLRIYEADILIVYCAPPTLTVDAPTGTITADTNPPIEWTPTYDVIGPATIDYEVKVFDSATYGGGGFDPESSTPTALVSAAGVSPGTASCDLADPLADGTYRAYIKLTANYSGGISVDSDWEYGGFVINVDKPGDPDLTLTPDDELARIAVDVEANSGDATTDYYVIERSDDGGSTFTEIRIPQEDGVPDGMVSQGIYDYEAPSSTTVTYRARAVHDFGGTYSYSDWVEASDEWTSTAWWIKHPTLPDLNAALKMRSYPGSSRPARQGVFMPLGASSAVVVADTRQPRTGNIVVMAVNAAEREQVDALLDAGVPLLIQGPPSNYEPDRWVVFGDAERARLLDKGWIEESDETLPWTEVARPSNDQLPGLFPAIDLLIP